MAMNTLTIDKTIMAAKHTKAEKEKEIGIMQKKILTTTQTLLKRHMTIHKEALTCKRSGCELPILEGQEVKVQRLGNRTFYFHLDCWNSMLY